jgi:alkylation response protein AidB-like acyl-CoA dehydrogenase
MKSGVLAHAEVVELADLSFGRRVAHHDRPNWVHLWLARFAGLRESRPVNLELTADQAFFRETTQRFLETETPISVVRQLHDLDRGFDLGWWRQAAELGWTSLLVDERAGGGSLSGRPVADAAIVAEELGRALGPGPFLPVNVVATALSSSGGAGHATILTSLVNGDAIATWALGEPASRWEAAGISTTAEIHGDDIVVTGTKRYVEAAPTADQLLVVARTGAGLTQVLVPAGARGVTVRRSNSLDLGRRFGEVRLEGVRLPLDAVVGEVGGAADDIERQLEVALVLQCAETVGSLDRVFAFTLAYMGDRYAFGRPISSYQALKHRVADLLLQLETAKACVDAAAAAVDEGSDQAPIEARVAKAYIGEISLHLLQECMQFHGGISVTWEHDIHLHLRRASVNRAVFGTPEQHRERICSLLGF